MSASKSCVSVQQLSTPSSFIHLVLNAAETGRSTSKEKQLCITDNAPKLYSIDCEFTVAFTILQFTLYGLFIASAKAKCYK